MPRLATTVALPLLLATPLLAQAGVSQAGAAQARLFASRGAIPPPSAFAVADILNERRHDIPLPARGEDLALSLRWSHGADARTFVQVGIATGAVADRNALPPVNLAFAIDCSGSMQTDKKLERVQQSLLAFVEQLRPSDRVALVAWSDDARLVVPSRPVGDLADLRRAIGDLRPNGSTNLHGGLMCALAEVARTRIAGTNRVILLTDGIANRGVTDPVAIAADATLLAGAGIDVTTVGFGVDAQTELLREIATKGHGAFHFVADTEDVAKVFVREAQSLLARIARQVVLELTIDPGLRVVRVLGPRPRAGEQLAFDLEDMNADASQVVLVELARCTTDRETRLPVQATLRWLEPRTGEPRVRRRTVEIHEPGAAPRDLDRIEPVDAAVNQERARDLARNLTIAELGAALRDMSCAWHEGRADAARRILGEAVARASRDPQVSQHPDVARVLATANRYREVLELGGAASTDR